MSSILQKSNKMTQFSYLNRPEKDEKMKMSPFYKEGERK